MGVLTSFRPARGPLSWGNPSSAFPTVRRREFGRRSGEDLLREHVHPVSVKSPPPPFCRTRGRTRRQDSWGSDVKAICQHLIASRAFPHGQRKSRSRATLAGRGPRLRPGAIPQHFCSAWPQWLLPQLRCLFLAGLFRHRQSISHHHLSILESIQSSMLNPRRQWQSRPCHPRMRRLEHPTSFCCTEHIFSP
jgi:hypothetical protein